MKYLLPPITYYKTNLHTHTTISDGKITPEGIRDAYRAAGYSILAITDHSVMVQHQHLNQEDFLLLTGVEIDLEEKDNPVNLRDRKLHMCLISKDPMKQWIPFRDPTAKPASVPYEAGCEIGGLPRRYDTETVNATIAECNRQGMLVIYNHPCWSLESYPEYGPMEGLWGMEYRNSSCVAGGYDENNGRVYQDFCMQGKHIMPVCADDAHNIVHRTNGYPVLGESWNMVGAEKLEYSAVIRALEQGDLYASCGPEIKSLTLNGDSLHLTCSEADRVQLISHTRLVSMVYAQGDEALTEATFDLAKWRKRSGSNENAFVRLIVTDKRGRYAVTRAYFASELTDE